MNLLPSVRVQAALVLTALTALLCGCQGSDSGVPPPAPGVGGESGAWSGFGEGVSGRLVVGKRGEAVDGGRDG
jgi:hypothetical protein